MWWPLTVETGGQESMMRHTRLSLALLGWTTLVCILRSFQPLSFTSVFCSPLPPYKNLCFHWHVEMGFETRAPHIPREMGLRQELPTFQIAGIWKNHFTSPSASWVLALKVAGSPTFVWLQVEVGKEGLNGDKIDFALGGGCTMQCPGDVYLSCTVLWTNVSPIKSIKHIFKTK